MSESSSINPKIYTLRNQRVMIDSDLAELYGVETRVLVQAVKRSLERFPEDFMFECNNNELTDMMSQSVTSYGPNNWNHKRKNAPLVFSEQGIAMLSTVLGSPRAIQVNIAIIRIFVRMRSFLLLEEPLTKQIKKLEKDTNKLFKIVFERIDSIEDQIEPKLSPKRKKIGLKP